MTLPNFLIVGAPKSGTTTLYELLRQHPNIYMPGFKEPRYFCDQKNVASWEEYLSLFSNARAARVGEASVNYLYAPEAPQRIYDRLGTIPILILLRAPVDQMYSMYQFNCRYNIEEKSFIDALEAEETRKAANRPSQLHYRSRAKYSDQIERYFNQFGKENVLVMTFEEFRQAPVKFAKEVYQFLGVDDSFTPNARKANAHGTPRMKWFHWLMTHRHPIKKPARLLPPNARDFLRRFLVEANLKPQNYAPLPPDLKKELTLEFQEEVERVSKLLGKDMSIYWKSYSKV